ncbi:hypothetical protein [Oryza sativa Japonica Group]|uniref:Uncharacterized protein n=1 Tax=Oryza sativa subsp. japonica TaxID=39947 RepID=Q5JKM6_ORYSJ|nr:hypothetical protein [Oryza sativa Japonica Group]BAD87981.1 hypothetical protein [Oryza sativa Japonica Group]
MASDSRLRAEKRAFGGSAVPVERERLLHTERSSVRRSVSAMERMSSAPEMNAVWRGDGGEERHGGGRRERGGRLAGLPASPSLSSAPPRFLTPATGLQLRSPSSSRYCQESVPVAQHEVPPPAKLWRRMDSRKVSRPSLLVRALLLSDSLGQLSLDARLPAAAAAAAEMAGAACPCSNPSRRPASPIAAAAVEMTGANHRATPAAASYPHW